MYIYGWFTLLYGRNQHIVKQLFSDYCKKEIGALTRVKIASEVFKTNVTVSKLNVYVLGNVTTIHSDKMFL